MNRKVLDEAIEVHGEELINVINQGLEGNKNGQSLLTQQQVENMLQEHFQKVEKLLESNQENRQTFPDFLDDLRHRLKEMLENFKDALIQKVQESKNNLTTGITDKVEHVKDSARNEIRNAVTDLTQQTKEMAQQLEDRFTQQDKGQEQMVFSKKYQPTLRGFLETEDGDKKVLNDLGITANELINGEEYSVTVQDLYNHNNTDEITIGAFQDDERHDRYIAYIASENHGMSTPGHLTAFKDYQNGKIGQQIQQQKTIQPEKEHKLDANSKQEKSKDVEVNDLKQEIKKLKTENQSLSNQNKELSRHNQGLQEKVDKVQDFFKEDVQARKSLNNFLSKDNAPKQEQQEEQSQGMGLA
ncbi:hypothetical protein [Virgibacillus siamensis]|uniref:hypothetical protein n=1 Tax=Virgibacillus siamensis TaxID=480071 RepID=UPI0011156E78|nr:hypothetical protein [Virgibacillus siamensis]